MDARWRQRGTIAAALLLVLLAYAQTLGWLWNAWTRDPYYTHGLLTAAVAVVLGARAWSRPGETAPAWAPVLVIVPLVLLAVGFVRHAAYAMAWSLPPLVAAMAFATGGDARARRVLPALALLAIAIPTPWTLDVGLALAQVATRAASLLLAAGGVALVSGVSTLEADGVTFDVTPACSGIQSAVSLLAVAMLLVALVPMPPRRRMLVLASAVPVALALNVLRIVAVVLVALNAGPAAAEGFLHGASGVLLFMGDLVVLAVIARVHRPEGGDA